MSVIVIVLLLLFVLVDLMVAAGIKTIPMKPVKDFIEFSIP
jgi:hypothetical protein